jgi:endogenous inhibitor of DNA gyrase (YacG/DUF329 family)
MEEATLPCPYCGETIVLDVEPGDLDHRYIEDCPVCCRPIELHARSAVDGTLEHLEASREGD